MARPKGMSRKRSKSMSRKRSKSMSRRNPKGMKKAKGIKDWANWLGLISKDKVNTTSISPSPVPSKGPLTRLQAKKNMDKEEIIAVSGMETGGQIYSQAEMKELAKNNPYYV